MQGKILIYWAKNDPKTVDYFVGNSRFKKKEGIEAVLEFESTASNLHQKRQPVQSSDLRQLCSLIPGSQTHRIIAASIGP